MLRTCFRQAPAAIASTDVLPERLSQAIASTSAEVTSCSSVSLGTRIPTGQNPSPATETPCLQDVEHRRKLADHSTAVAALQSELCSLHDSLVAAKAEAQTAGAELLAARARSTALSHSLLAVQASASAAQAASEASAAILNARLEATAHAAAASQAAAEANTAGLEGRLRGLKALLAANERQAAEAASGLREEMATVQGERGAAQQALQETLFVRNAAFARITQQRATLDKLRAQLAEATSRLATKLGTGVWHLRTMFCHHSGEHIAWLSAMSLSF